MVRTIAPAKAAAPFRRLLASLALLVPLVAAARAEDAAPAIPDLPVPKAESLLGVDIDYDHVISYMEHDKGARSGDWDLKYNLDDGGGALTRSASSASTNTHDARLNIDHESKTRCDRREPEISVTLGEADARFDADALSKKGGDKASLWIFAGDHGVFDAKPQRRQMLWNLDSGDLSFSLATEVFLKHGQIALCPTPVATQGIASGCSLFSLKGFSGAYDYVCDAKEAR
ncbi:hypothetical protein [Methylocapsa sp. S129]|uniref:hypothetical protein n=1 Tax=Methylocapsa sp. S129 TaxID=1641869 RepID=UPI00131CBB16|nr:hypothetical protein [Methylocapsa sp. S129]